MKKCNKSFLSILLVFFFMLSLISVSADSLNNEKDSDVFENKKVLCTATLEDDFADDCVIVVINSNYSSINKRFSLSDFNKDIFEEIIDLSAVDGDILEKEYLNTEDFKQILKLRLKKSGKQEVLNAIKELEKLDWIESAEPNYICQPICFEETDLERTSNEIQAYSAKVNDPKINDNIESLNKMNIPPAWDLETGKKEIRVGIIDSGIYEHEDLKANIIKGWDFVNNNDVTNDDSTGHGTLVAGIIGAVGNNGKGMTGVCWNVSLVPLQVIEADGGMETANAARAVQYANNNNIPIINCSWGMDPGDKNNLLEASLHNYKGLAVCAAGQRQRRKERVE